MERIDDNYACDEISEEDVDNLRNMTKEELVQMISNFANENIKLIKWLYRYHRDILRDYENRFMGGTHIEFD